MNTESQTHHATNTESFYVVAKEPGAEHPALPTWANRDANPAQLKQDLHNNVQRIDIDAVPGAFQLLNVLTKEECQQFINITESLGYLPDAAVSLPRHVRHNDNVTWVADELTIDTIWQRCQPLFTDDQNIFNGSKALGLNGRFRFYRYKKGDFFKTHTDGAWPGSRVINEQLHGDAFGDRFSQMTFLIFLTEDFEGGNTQFIVNKDDPLLPAKYNGSTKTVDVRTPTGGVLCFPHGMHPLHRLHSSQEIHSGIKYIIRSDVLFEL
ncbi:oxidoreductase [Pseudomonas sp. HK3]